jgi:hypothetical protein
VLREQPTQTTYVVGVARTGLFTTALTFQTDVVPERADLQGVADLLGTAVERLCDLPDGGKCAAAPAKVEAAPPYPTGDVPAMLSELDLPPVGAEPSRWAAPAASEITPGSTSTGMIGCSSIAFVGSFRGKEFTHALVRDWVLPDANLPPEVGLTQTVASLPPSPAADLVAQVRDQVAKCPDEDAGAGTDVQRLAGWDRGDQSLTAWHLVTRVTTDKTIDYDVAILRDHGAVSQLTYVAAKDAPMPPDAFVALSERALQRLATMPSYRDH